MKNETPETPERATPAEVFERDDWGNEVVRVRDKATKHEYTTPRSVFEAERDGLTRIDKPALESDGKWARPKHHKDLSAL